MVELYSPFRCIRLTCQMYTLNSWRPQRQTQPITAGRVVLGILWDLRLIHIRRGLRSLSRRGTMQRTGWQRWQGFCTTGCPGIYDGKSAPVGLFSRGMRPTTRIGRAIRRIPAGGRRLEVLAHRRRLGTESRRHSWRMICLHVAMLNSEGN